MKKLNTIQRFILRAIIIYSIWLGVFYQWGAKQGGFDDQMTELTSYTVINILTAVDHNTTGRWVNTQSLRDAKKVYAPLQEDAKMFFINMNGRDTVAVANRCNALFTIALYVGFIMVYPGRWKPKIIFILVGSFIIFSSNVIRIIILSYNSFYSPETLDFNHKYTYTFVVYSVVFVFWMWWVNRYSSIADTRLIKKINV